MARRVAGELRADVAAVRRHRPAVEAGQIVDALNHDEALLTFLYSAGGNPFSWR